VKGNSVSSLSNKISVSGSFEAIWECVDPLERHKTELRYEEILLRRNQNVQKMRRDFWAPVADLLSQLPLGETVTSGKELLKNFCVDAVTLGSSADLQAPQMEVLNQVVEKLMPWRKGPFSLFGIEIDSEWKSNWKWDRIVPELGDISGLKIADVGCGNGYYMFRAAAAAPELVIGFDPSEHFYYQFQLVQRFAQFPFVSYEPMGLEDLQLFEGFFDLVLCMGIVYHHRNPIEQLKILLDALAPGGQVIVESQTIPGTEPIALFPKDRYAKARNIYFIPTANCLAAWLEKVGFVDIEVFSDVQLTCEEQRRTKFAVFESLSDFLDSNDLSKTVEGYPAPRRACVKARKRG